jgi:sRNA-binding carbon storage regulator CsrA
MRRKIILTLETNDEDVNITITPVGKDTVLITADAPKFIISSDELKEALAEGEKYRLEFEAKEA